MNYRSQTINLSVGTIEEKEKRLKNIFYKLMN